MCSQFMDPNYTVACDQQTSIGTSGSRSGRRIEEEADDE